MSKKVTERRERGGGTGTDRQLPNLFSFYTVVECVLHYLHSGMAGSESIADLRISIRRGFSQLEGVTSELRSVKYFWSPVSQHRHTR